MPKSILLILVVSAFSIDASGKTEYPPDAFSLYAPVGLPAQIVPTKLEGFFSLDQFWQTIAMPVDTPDRLTHAAVYNPVNDKIYMIGGTPNGNAGSNVNLCQEYNPVANTWTDKAPMSVARGWIQGAVITRLGTQGRIYVMCGFSNAGTALNVNEYYDCASNTWTTVAPSPRATCAYQIAVWRDSLIYLIGGTSPTLGGGETRVSIYDPFTNTWNTTATNLPEHCDMGSAVIIGDTIYIVGGYNRTSGTLWTNMRKGAINPANPTQITWITGPTVPPYLNCAAASIGNRVYWLDGPSPRGTRVLFYTQGIDTIYDFVPYPIFVSRTQMVARTIGNLRELYVIAGDEGGDWSPPNRVYMKCRIYENNVAATEIVSPTGIITAGIPVPVKAKISNEGENPMTFDVRFTIGTVYDDTVFGINLPSLCDTVISFENWIAIPGNHTAKCSILTNDDSLGDNVVSSTFIVPSFVKDFEADSGMFTPDPPTNAWVWDSLSGHSGTRCWKTGWYGYLPNANWMLTSPWLEVIDADNAIMAFYHWYQIEPFWDVGNVKFRKGPADTWRIIDPIGGYPQPPGHFPERGYGGSQPNWSPAIFPLTGLGLVNGDSIQIRFHLQSDPSITHPGWYVDDFCGYGIRYRIRDVGIVRLVSISPISVLVKNYGIFTATFPVYLRILDSLGNLIYQDSRTVFSLLPDSARVVSFSYFAGLGFRVIIFTALFGDQNPSNDTLDTIIPRVHITEPSDIQFLPKVFALDDNLPNPFISQTMIRYTLPKDCKVSLKIHNSSGVLIRTLKAGTEKAGFYKVVWNGNDENGKKVSKGVYFYRLEAGEFTATKKMVKLE